MSPKTMKATSDRRLIELSTREYLSLVTSVSTTGNIQEDIKAHQKVNSLLLGREYPHFGVTGVKTVYYLLCLRGEYGATYNAVKTLDEIKGIIGGSKDYSTASDLFWKECIARILEKDPFHRKKMYSFSENERAIWVRFYRKSAASCNKKRKVC